MTDEEAKKLGVFGWPTWEKEQSEFDWHYDSREECFFLEGEVEVTDSSGKTAFIRKGDFATFPQGLGCRWKVIKKVRKHYNFG